jgi:hypothetical protein
MADMSKFQVGFALDDSVVSGKLSATTIHYDVAESVNGHYGDH